MKRTCIAILLLLTLAACGRQAQAYEGPKEITDALADSEIACEGLEVTEGASMPDSGQDSLVEQRGVCTVDDIEVTIITFANEGDRDDWLAVGGLLGPTAYGPNWAVTGADEVIDEIAAALDAATEEV